ncbi:MAG: hypothetical protein HKN47_14000 [Pirellulaceae bacterium]|nr:hypothetical protein [Pirellulaceae bacterium]
MQTRIAEQLGSMATPGTWGQSSDRWATADEFLEMLKTTSDDEEFISSASSLAETRQQVFNESIRQLTSLLSTSDARSRQRALITIGFMQHYRPEQMTEHTDSVVAAIIPLLSDLDENAEAIGTLEAFGSNARDAIGPLRSIMDDDNAWFAPAAAVAVARIDPTVEIGTRLAEFVSRHPDWYTAAFHLGEHMESHQARRVLLKAYKEDKDELKRSGIIQALNQIQIEPEQ